MKKEYIYAIGGFAILYGLYLLNKNKTISTNTKTSISTNTSNNIFGESIDYLKLQHLSGDEYIYNGNVYLITHSPCETLVATAHPMICWNCTDPKGNPCRLYNFPI
jgi:hypothetical protein